MDDLPPFRRSRWGEGGGAGDHPVAALYRAAAALLRGSLVKELERLGIGRPSTYSAIISTLSAEST